jgi:probable HAF family extracellular repeat protein
MLIERTNWIKEETMQTNTASSTARAPRRWRLATLIAAACASMALGAAAATAVAGAPLPTTYRVVPLAPNGFPAGINSKGQVAFTAFEGDVPLARFYDGSTVRNLGAFGGTAAVAYALNELGQVAGTAETAAGVFHAFRWSRASGLVDLNRPGVGNSIGIDINNKGQVAGTARFTPPSNMSHAFRWSPAGGMVDLGALGPTSESLAYGINDAGTAVGWSDEASGPRLTQVTKWPAGGGGPIPLNAFPSIASIALDINNAGQIVGGAAFDTRLNDQAFLWTREGGLQGLGTEPSYQSWADRISEKGLVIGQLYSTPSDRNGFIWSRDSGLLTVGTPITDSSDTADVNNRGQVVGSLNGRGYLWTRSGGFVDLTSRVVGAPPDLTLFSGLVLNDNGTIVAATNAGTLVLLVPTACHALPPVAGPVKYTGAARVNTLLSFAAGFQDVDLRDTHKAVWSWGDGGKTAGTVSERNGAGSVSGQHAYRAAGIYTVRLTVTDSSGKDSSVERKVVVGAGQGAVRGQGAFASPANAAAGGRRASIGRFAFLSGDGAGKAAVEVDVAGLALRSSRIDTVALDGARVQYSGQGSVNGKGGYRFTLTATSGAGTGNSAGGKDFVHVRIAHTEPGSTVEVVDYDNGAAATGAAQKAAAGPEGSVVIGEGKIELAGN